MAVIPGRRTTPGGDLGPKSRQFLHRELNDGSPALLGDNLCVPVGDRVGIEVRQKSPGFAQDAFLWQQWARGPVHAA
jgi:hypothetical protein